MKAWRKFWREGLSPLLGTSALHSLAAALERDDPRLMQNGTTWPPASDVTSLEAVQAACAIGWCAWHDEGLQTVGAVDHRFQQLCQAADERLGERAACRFFLNWFDETPRAEMRQQLLAETLRTLRQRTQCATRAAG